MKYGSGIIDYREVIDRYEITNDKIIVYYSNGRVREYDYTQEKENEILDLMLKLAIERDSTVNIERLESELKIYRFTLSLTTIITIMNLITCINDNCKNKGFMTVSILTLLILAAIISYFTKTKKDEINELKKYRIYLQNKHEIDKYINSKELYGNIDKEVLSINSVDQYTYKEMKQIEKNLVLCKRKDFI